MTPKKGAWKPKFIEHLSQTGNVAASAREAGVSRTMAYKERDSSRQFRELWDEAVEEGVDELEAEARRRASEGVEEPVFYQGQEVGAVRKYSDTLLIFLLKGRRSEVFGDRVKQEVSGPGGAPVSIRVVYDDRH